MMTKGIIDPTKVVRAAIQNAASVAGLLITTEAMVAEVPQKKGRAACRRAAAAWAAWISDPLTAKMQRPGRNPGPFTFGSPYRLGATSLAQ